MLARVLEPEVMDTADDAADYDAMDHAAVNAKFVDDALAFGVDGTRVLDVGTGTALIPIEFCARVPEAFFIAVDAAESMLAVARQHLARLGRVGQVVLIRCRVQELPPDFGAFSAVVSNSLIHHLPEPLDAFAAMHHACHASGRLFVRDLLRPSSRAELDGLVETYAAGANAHQRQLFADSLAAALTLAEVRELVAALGYPAGTVAQTSDRHWTWAAARA